MTPTPTPTPFLTTAPSTLDEGVSCRPNISEAGRKRRKRFGRLWALAGVVGLGICVALRAPWYWRALLAVPAGLSAVGFLQGYRGTCLARAGEGTFEHDDFSKTRAAEADAVRSRLAAASIARDTFILAILCGVGAAATVLAR